MTPYQHAFKIMVDALRLEPMGTPLILGYADDASEVVKFLDNARKMFVFMPPDWLDSLFAVAPVQQTPIESTPSSITDPRYYVADVAGMIIAGPFTDEAQARKVKHDEQVELYLVTAKGNSVLATRFPDSDTWIDAHDTSQG
jgi:hypothetical protein